MAKKYKHQQLMIEKGVTSPCPFNDCREVGFKAYHFGYDPITYEKNFEPGHRRNPRQNAKDDIENCSYCGLSMFETEEAARQKWTRVFNNLIRANLGYTHLLYGELREEFGVASAAKNAHFTFFEYEGVELKNHFKSDPQPL